MIVIWGAAHSAPKAPRYGTPRQPEEEEPHAPKAAAWGQGARKGKRQKAESQQKHEPMQIIQRMELCAGAIQEKCIPEDINSLVSLTFMKNYIYYFS